jgi:hypothetical protein
MVRCGLEKSVQRKEMILFFLVVVVVAIIHILFLSISCPASCTFSNVNSDCGAVDDGHGLTRHDVISLVAEPGSL